MRGWIDTADLPDDNELKEELIEAQFGHTRVQKRGELLILEKKKHIRARLKRSTDKADALAHTFYYALAGGSGPPSGAVFGGVEAVEPLEAWL